MTSRGDTQGMERVGRYRLIRPLGHGGMATVHIARCDDDGRLCVVKQLHVEFERNDVALARFMREAHVASRLDHPNIAKVWGAGMEDDRFCIAGEYVPGETLEAVMIAAQSAGGVLPYEVSANLVIQALRALEHAHGLAEDGRHLGLVHRDLSPRNIMIDYSGTVKLIDFGIAKADVDELKTTAGALLGTPFYMSPEQATGQAVDHRADLYTLGAVLFELLTGQRLVQATGRAQILYAVARHEAPAVSSVNPLVPSFFDDIVGYALAKNREHRHSSASAFRAALEGAAGRLPATSPEAIGELVSSLFRERAASASALLAEHAAASDDPVFVTSEDTPAARSSRERKSSGRRRDAVAFATTDVGGQSSDGFLGIAAQPTSRRWPVRPYFARALAVGLIVGAIVLFWGRAHDRSERPIAVADRPESSDAANSSAPIVVPRRGASDPLATDRSTDEALDANRDVDPMRGKDEKAHVRSSLPSRTSSPREQRNHPISARDGGTPSPQEEPSRPTATAKDEAELRSRRASPGSTRSWALELAEIASLLDQAENEHDLELAYRARAKIALVADALPSDVKRRVLADTQAALWAQGLDDVLHNLRRAHRRMAAAQVRAD